MKELEQAVSAAFANIIAAGTIEKAIEEKLAKTITSIFEEELRSYSDFGQQIKAQVQAALKVDFSNLGLPAYNDLILKIIRAKVGDSVQGTLASQIEAQMSELLSPAPAEIKLSDLVADFISDRFEYRGCSCDSPSQITLIVDSSETSDGYHHIHLDEGPGKRIYGCAYQIAVSPEGRVYSLKIDDHDPKKSIFVGPLYRFDRRLFQMYTAGTKLIIDGDEDSIDTYYPGHD